VTTDELLEKATPRPWANHHGYPGQVRFGAPAPVGKLLGSLFAAEAPANRQLILRAVNSFEAALGIVREVASVFDSDNPDSQNARDYYSENDLDRLGARAAKTLKLMEGEK
jgi:hypothetical protein